MKQSTKYKLNQLRLYLGVVLLCYVIVNTVLYVLSSFLFPHSSMVSTIACILSFLIAVTFVIRHVRCRPLTQEEKEGGLLFQVRLMK